MSPRKRKYETATERKRAFRERQRAAGNRQVNLWFPGDLLEALDKEAEKLGIDRNAYIIELIRKGRGK